MDIPNKQKGPLDEKDLAILEMLKQNARASIRTIAKKTGIRPSTVHQRMSKLEKEGVILAYTTHISPKAIEEGFTIFMFIKGKLSKYLDSDFLTKQNVKEVFGITGEYDLLLKLKFRDVEAFNTFIISFREQQKGITATHTFVATTTLKESL